MGCRAAALTAAASETKSGSSVTATLAVGQSATAKFPPAQVTKFRTIAQDALAKVQGGNQAAATARIKHLETAWDDNQATLQPFDDTGCTVPGWPDRQRLSTLRGQADPATETQTLTSLLTALQ